MWAVPLGAKAGPPSTGPRKARRAWGGCTDTVARLTIEEIGIHLLARSVMGVQEGKVVVVYVHVGGKAPNERLTYDHRGGDTLLARRHRAGTINRQTLATGGAVGGAAQRGD